jgi:hypothetical protein
MRKAMIASAWLQASNLTMPRHPCLAKASRHNKLTYLFQRPGFLWVAPRVQFGADFQPRFGGEEREGMEKPKRARKRKLDTAKVNLKPLSAVLRRTGCLS